MFRWWFAAASLVSNPPPKRRKYAEFGTMCIRVPVKSMPCLFCVMYKVYIYFYKYYYLVFRAVRTLRWCHLELAPGVLNRWRHTHPILIIAYTPMLFYLKQLLTNRKIVQTAWMTKSNYIPASHGQVQPTKLAIRIFFTRILVVVCSGLRWFALVCGGLPAFHRFHCLSSHILVVVCGGLRWFVVVCGGLWWFAVVCLIVIPAQTQSLNCCVSVRRSLS